MATAVQYEDGPGRGFNKNTAANTSALWGSDVLERPPWMADANCKGAATGLFFSERGQNAAVTEAKQVCLGCTVRNECLDYAIATHQVFGVWGGTTENERRRIRRKIAVAGA